jgi:hypothetical protein
MSVTTITPDDYHRHPDTRDLADRLLDLAGLPKEGVALIEKSATGWRFKVLDVNGEGRHFFGLDGDLAHHWVDLEVAA